MSDPVLDIFREEAREHLGALEKAFLDMEAAGTAEVRRELIDSLFRHAHSLKGDARVVGVRPLTEAAQQLEDILDDLRENPERVDRAAVGRGLAQFDAVRGAFERWQRGDVADSADPADEPAAVRPPPADAAATTGVEIVQPEPADPRPGPPAVAAPTAVAEDSFTVRVPSDRLDRMLNLAGEVRICHRSGESLAARLAELREHLTRLGKVPDRAAQDQRQAVEAALDQVRRIESDLRKKRTREELLVEALEADIREARLLPLVMLTDTLRRTVRDLAGSLGKAIHYESQVGRVLLDKAVIEALKDPLQHLVRNAADHGIEPADERRAAGKPAEGTIRIAAAQQGPLVRITVSDDGRGVNFPRIREQVRRSGPPEGADLSDQALAGYLFKAGFSTAPRGEVSGRGVGLDVVRDTVSRLQGRVELESTSPAGTTFALTVPVTVSTLRILTVFAAGSYYGVPTAAIRRTGRARPEDLRELAGRRVLMIGGQPLRWTHLAELLGGPPAERAAEKAWSYLLVAQPGQDLAVAVDDLEDESEALLKPLGFPLGALAGVIGAVLRADGAVQLVLDLTNPIWGTADNPPARRRVERSERGRILVVDDSPTTRAVLRSVFAAAGYAVVTASDGVDALERLRSGVVDLVVSDVEMPRLNGLDLTRQIKGKYRLPVILVTGRETEDYRREGLLAGADAYVVKSTFQGEGLLDIVQQFV